MPLPSVNLQKVLSQTQTFAVFLVATTERLLAFHAAGVGPISDRHPAADKGLGLVPMQRQGRALGHCRVYGGEIILQCHSDTACQIVQLRDAIHVHGHVKINGFSQQKTFHCLTGILAAFLLAIAEATRKADLHLFGADGAAKVAQHGAFVMVSRSIFN